MTTYESASTTGSGEGRTTVLARHPLASYVLLAFSGTWLVVLPAVLARGFGLFALEMPVAAALVILGPFTGPLAASLLVTYTAEGTAGLKTFLRRFIQVRVGVGWYVLVAAGYPMVYLFGLLPVLGIDAYSGVGQKLPAALMAYLPALMINLIMPSLGEEPGWRGFALPRLQHQFGPLWGTLILGSLHALWHLPVYIIPGFMQPGPFDPLIFFANSGTIIAVSVLWTWLNNHARGSIFFAMLVHASSNASPAPLTMLFGEIRPGVWFGFTLFGICALLTIFLTRGRLSYQDGRG